MFKIRKVESLQELGERTDAHDKDSEYYKILNQDLPNYVDSNGRSLLHGAAMINLDKVKYLSFIPIDVTDIDGNTPLHCACEKGLLDIVKYLVEQRGASVNSANNAGCTALHVSCKMKHAGVSNYLIQKCRADIYVQDQRNYTPMHYTCESGCSGSLLFLMKVVSPQFLAANMASLIDIANSNNHTGMVDILTDSPEQHMEVLVCTFAVTYIIKIKKNKIYCHAF